MTLTLYALRLFSDIAIYMQMLFKNEARRARIGSYSLTVCVFWLIIEVDLTHDVFRLVTHTVMTGRERGYTQASRHAGRGGGWGEGGRSREGRKGTKRGREGRARLCKGVE